MLKITTQSTRYINDEYVASIRGKLIQKLLLNQKCMGYLVRVYYSISPTSFQDTRLIQKLRDDKKCMKKVEPSSKSKTIEDIISIGSFVEAIVLNHYVLIRKIFLLNAASITAALINVNATPSKLVLLENFNENYSKCLRLLVKLQPPVQSYYYSVIVSTASVKLLLLYKVNVAEGVNAASEEVNTVELVSTAYWDQQVVLEQVALRNLLENIDQDFAHMVAASKVPMLKPGEFKLWRIRIKQYIQMIDYALWEVIENGATLPKSAVVEGVEKLKFNSINDAKLLLEAIEKRFGGNAATKKTQRNLLKQQYENFTTLSSKMLDQTFDRLQNLWNTHAVLWRNKVELETISMDDLYNKLKVYEPEVKGMSSSSSSTQNMVFVSSSNNNTSSSNEAVNAAHRVTTASTQVNTAYSTNIDNLSD
ncbi:hypothetical protein Tco_0583545, partial [Tanacetum coccineum]